MVCLLVAHGTCWRTVGMRWVPALALVGCPCAIGRRNRSSVWPGKRAAHAADSDPTGARRQSSGTGLLFPGPDCRPVAVAVAVAIHEVCTPCAWWPSDSEKRAQASPEDASNGSREQLWVPSAARGRPTEWTLCDSAAMRRKLHDVFASMTSADIMLIPAVTPCAARSRRRTPRSYRRLIFWRRSTALPKASTVVDGRKAWRRVARSSIIAASGTVVAVMPSAARSWSTACFMRPTSATTCAGTHRGPTHGTMTSFAGDGGLPVGIRSCVVVAAEVRQVAEARIGQTAGQLGGHRRGGDDSIALRRHAGTRCHGGRSSRAVAECRKVLGRRTGGRQDRRKPRCPRKRSRPLPPGASWARRCSTIGLDRSDPLRGGVQQGRPCAGAACSSARACRSRRSSSVSRRCCSASWAIAASTPSTVPERAGPPSVEPKCSTCRSPADRSPAPVVAEDAEELDAVDGVDGAVEDVRLNRSRRIHRNRGCDCAAARWSAAPGLTDRPESLGGAHAAAGSSPPACLRWDATRTADAGAGAGEATIGMP